jgi:hypothetical protein
MIVASSAGRSSIAQEVDFRHGAVGTVWVGNSKDKMADGIEICCEHPVRSATIGWNSNA